MVNTINFKVCKTVSIFVIFTGLGIGTGVIGPTLPSLEILLDADTTSMGVSLSFHGGGFLLGAVLCGCIYDRMNSEFQFTCISFLGATTALLATLFGDIYSFTALITIHTVCKGFLDTAGSPYILHLWHGHHQKAAILQALHLVFCIGSSLAPFIISPFLANIPIDRGNRTFNNDTSRGVASSSFCNGSIYNCNNSNMSELHMLESIGDVDKVVYAYIFLGLFTGLGFIMFAVLYCIDEARLTCRKVERITINHTAKIDYDEDIYSATPLSLRIILLSLAFAFFVFHVSVEGVPSNFASILSTKGYLWTVQFGGLLTSVLWIGIGTSRLVTVPLSLFVSPNVIITTGLILLSTGFILLLFLDSLGHAGAITGMALAGFGCGPFHATLMTWLSTYILFSGAAAAVCNVGAAVGKIGFFALTGYMMQSFGATWMVYISLVGTAVLMTIFGLMNLCARCLSQHKSGSINDKNDTRADMMTEK